MKQNKVELKPKAFGKSVFFLCVLIGIITFAQKCHAQCTYEFSNKGVFVNANAGITKQKFAHELHAGYQRNYFTASIGYNSIPDAAHPVMFQLRVGYVIAKRVHLYAGPVNVVYSLDDKSRNYYTYHVGAQLHGMHYDRGTIYITASYTPGFVSAGVGMSFNLIKSEQ